MSKHKVTNADLMVELVTLGWNVDILIAQYDGYRHVVEVASEFHGPGSFHYEPNNFNRCAICAAIAELDTSFELG
jgi:hypothetical protein